MTPSSRLYETSGQQLSAELAWLELLMKREVALVRRGRSHEEKFDEFSGLYVSEEDIDAYLAEASDQPASPEPEILRLEERIRAARGRLDDKAESSLAAGVDLRLSRLARTFELEPQEVLTLLACFAPDVDLRFQKYFAYLQNDIAKRRPTVQLLHRFGLREQSPAFGARATFGSEGRLLSRGLLSLPASRSEDCFPLLQPRVARSVADFLAGIDRVDDDSRAAVTYSAVPVSLHAATYFDRHRSHVARWLEAPERLVGEPVVLLGPAGCGRRDLVGAFATALGRTLLTVDGATLATRAEEMAAQLRSLARDARLLRAVVLIANVEELRVEEGPAQVRLAALGEALSREPIDYVFLISSDRLPDLERRLSPPVRCCELPRPSIDERRELWQEMLPATLRASEPDLASALASRFSFTPAKQRAAAQRAAQGSAYPAHGESVSRRDYFEACRSESNQNLSRFGKKMAMVYGWGDVVLPADTRSQLLEICACVRHKQQVYERWGFGDKFSLGKGLNVLFAGGSGTGKTMCAEIIAGDLELDAFKIDLSCVVSKYVGETERNLSRIFEEAETSNSILFFDEADALFGKRSEVKDAHDRYANIEINYLLQKLDDYEGIVILATNLRGNLDKAFTRRLSYLVEFPFPDEQYRERIWAQVFPDDTPLRDDVKFDFLARKFKLAGGNIKNIAVNSAFLAAGNGGRVGMEQVILATKREYQKLGRLCSKSEFGPYFNLIQESGS